MKYIPIIQLGIGNVGREVIRKVLDYNKSDPTKTFRYIGIANSKTIIFHTGGITEQLLEKILSGIPLIKTQDGSDFFKHNGDLSPLMDLSDQLDFNSLSIIDTTDSSTHLPCLLECAGRGATMVFANKKPLVQEMSSFRKLSRVHPGYRATVGAGLPVIPEIENLITNNRKIRKIEGCFSGSLGILCSSLEKGRQFSSIVKELKEAGYTEPDPRVDLSGIDMARKIMIISRMCGYGIELNNVTIQSLFPAWMANLPAKEFLSKLSSVDDDYRTRFTLADQRNATLRYVATSEGGRCEVGLKEVTRDSDIGRLQGAEKLALIYTGKNWNNPIIVRGAGAGATSAAKDVVDDLIEVNQ